MEIDECFSCPATAGVSLVECPGCMKATWMLCARCALGWRCPECLPSTERPYALTFALDATGLPHVVDLDAKGCPPAGAVKIVPTMSFAERWRDYLLFRESVVKSQSGDVMAAPVLAEYGALLRDGATGAFASAGDGQRTGVTDTYTLAPPRKLRVMSWNLQDLGGGPSRGPTRSDTTLRRIARVIDEVAPDICVLLELKLSSHPPTKPKPPPEPRATRGSNLASLTNKVALRQAAYEKDLEAWLEAMKKYEAAKASSQPPGWLEVNKIMEVLGTLGATSQLPSWDVCLDKSLHTQNESYAFIFRTFIALQIAGVIDKDPRDQPLHWPEPGYRSPVRATFRLSGSRVGRQKGNTDEDRDLDIIAFHAPAPNHGPKVSQAIEQFKQINLPRETVFAGDFNVDTEFGNAEQEEKYRKQIEDAATTEDAEELFASGASSVPTRSWTRIERSSKDSSTTSLGASRVPSPTAASGWRALTSSARPCARQ